MSFRGGITTSQGFSETKHKGFIIPEAVIAKSFRGRFLCSLKKLHDDGKLDLPEHLNDPVQWKAFIEKLFSQKWFPFVKETFNGKGNAIEYLGRYAYRTAISNSRIVSVDDEYVTFRYKDYADHNATKMMTVKGMEFIDLFLKHVLPSGFSRIRYSGILSNCQRTKNLKLIHHLRGTKYAGNPFRNMNTHDLILSLFNRDISCCVHCGGHHMLIVESCRGRPKTMAPSHQAISIATGS